MKLTTRQQIGKQVKIVTYNGTFSGVLIEEHDRNFKHGCIDIGVKGDVSVFDHRGKLVGYRIGSKKQSIPVKNIIRVVMVRKTENQSC